jgi:hypothetical protein
MPEQEAMSPGAEIESRESFKEKLTKKAEEAKEMAAKLRDYKPSNQSEEERSERNLLEGDAWAQINEGNAQLKYVQDNEDVEVDYIEFAIDRFEAAIQIIQEYLDARAASNSEVE